MKTTESVLREYIQFEDVNQSETIELLPLTIIDAMDEYANQQERSYSEEDMRKAIQETITLMRYKATEFREHENTILEQFKKK
jgi:hypothetical protein